MMQWWIRLQIVSVSVRDGLRERGVLATAKMTWAALQDYVENKRRGYLVGPYLDPRTEAAHSASAIHGNFYQPLRSKPFLKLLKGLQPNLAESFVDIGAGTGKGLLLAAEFGFKRVRGVELIEELCKIGDENLKIFAPKFPHTSFQLVCGDALEFPFEKNDGFFFLNDPFYEPVFSPFVDRLVRFRQERGRGFILVYKNNSMRVIPSLQRLKALGSFEVRDLLGNRFEVYRVN